jgi:uncharacterized membrane protein YfcA
VKDGARVRIPSWTLGAWLGGTFLGTICGIGGGIFAVPLLHYGVRVPFQRAVGTSLVLVMVMTIVATIAESARPDSAIDWGVVGLLLLGAVPGAQAGYAVAKRAAARALKSAFALVLVVAAARIATISAHNGVTHEGEIPLTVAQAVWVGVLGFGGGFLAPILGVGGGILVIPALFLSLPQIGYLDARACSMAMSIVNAAQSSWMYFKDRAVDGRAAGAFGVVAVAGAVAGVFAVHQPGWSSVARIAMTAMLIAVAARMAVDVWTTRRAPARAAQRNETSAQ